MTMHFTTVPVTAGPYQALLRPQDPLRPLALVVDDEPIITNTLAAILDGVGFAALTAYNGIAALETARLIPPQVLVTDLEMPGMDGLDLASAVARATPDCEVILFSGHAAIFDMGARMRSLACDFATLIKPVHPADLIDCICERLERRGCPAVPATRHRPPTIDELMFQGRPGRDSSVSSWMITARERIRSSTAFA